MSLVIAIKENGRVYMGADCRIKNEFCYKTLTNPSNFKIWKVKGVDNCLMGHSGRYRDACVIKCIDNLVEPEAVLNDKVDFEYVVKNIVPRIQEELKNYGYLDSGNKFINMEDKFIFVCKNKIFEINCDGSVIEWDNFAIIGSGEAEAYGIVSSNVFESAERVIYNAIKAAASHDFYVGLPVVIMNTVDAEYIIKNN